MNLNLAQILLKNGEDSLSLAEFLVNVLEPTTNTELAAARSIFLAGGLAALEAAQSQQWIQFGLSAPNRHIYAELAEMVTNLLASKQIDDFFYMHKEPGLRIRFATKSEQIGHIRQEITQQLAQWKSESLIDGFVPSIYEPEYALFGGPESMRYVHQLFTVDSLAWLDYHSGDHDKVPNWALSLLMLRSVFSGLHIVGWEDRSVFSRVRDIGHRKLPHLDNETSLLTAQEELRRWWSDSGALLDQLPDATRHLVDQHATDIAEITEEWRANYFVTDKAVVGPREAASYYVIFHWNRAGLSSGRQALITEALASGPHFIEEPNDN